MDWAGTLDAKSTALKFCSDVLKCINDLSLEAPKSLDGERVQEEYIKQVKKVKRLCEKACL